MRSLGGWLAMWMLWAVSAALTAIALSSPRLPAATSAGDFSVDRALAHLRVVAAAPRPVGSPNHDAIRDDLVTKMRELGMRVDLQTTSASAVMAGHIVSANLTNVVARLRGSGPPAPALLLAAHYDSVEASPGASDDGSGVVTLLEAARALAAGAPLEHDIVFLFSDAEELGMLGAQAFVAESPDRRDIALALNFDARGTHGAVTMFATSKDNGRLIDALAAAPVHAVASSFISTLAQTLPNDTDASIFSAAGIPTYSFAYADGLEHYHRFSDTNDALDPRSLAHAGDYAVRLARYFAAGRLHDLAAPDHVYFDLFGRALVHYPLWAARAMTAALAALLIGLAAYGVTTSKVRAGAVLRSVARSALRVLVVVMGTGLLGWLSTLALPLRDVMAHAKWLFAGEVLLALSLWLAIDDRSSRHADAGRADPRAGDARPLERWAGVATLWALVLTAVTFTAPAATAPFAWPLASGLVAAGILAVAAAPAPLTRALVAVGLVPACVMMTQATYASLVATGAVMPAVPALFAGLLFTALLPAGGLEERGAARAASRVVAILGAALLAIGVALVVRERRTARSDSLVFAVDGDAGVARWITFDDDPDTWVAQRVPKGSDRARLSTLTRWNPPLLSARAAAVPLLPAAVEVEHGREQGPARRVTLVVTAAADVRCLRLWQEGGPPIDLRAVNERGARQFVRFSPQIDAELLRVLTADKNRPGWHLRHCGARGQAVTFDLELAGTAPLHLRLVEERLGLPHDPAWAPRPASYAPAQESDVTLYARALVL